MMPSGNAVKSSPSFCMALQPVWVLGVASPQAYPGYTVTKHYNTGFLFFVLVPSSMHISESQLGDMPGTHHSKAVGSPGSLSSSSSCASMGVTAVADTDGVPLAAGDSANPTT